MIPPFRTLAEETVICHLSQIDRFPMSQNYPSKHLEFYILFLTFAIELYKVKMKKPAITAANDAVYCPVLL